ncbi:TetR/AcrR family transcriptional regulator [Aquibium sp. LZ166]|uniref:TetR/AcrR family transcriptional regulator n=1 Tax=Aquibium pacificus TaxID=3153579 RepID=A0ABV3SR28_9HYPH
MPRPKKLSDEDVLDAALHVMHARGPDALTFAALAESCGLSSATLVQRFANKPNLVRQTVLHAWDGLDAQTEALASSIPRTPAGAIDLLVGLSAQYGGIEEYAEGLLLLREDLRDPVLRARGAIWKSRLCPVLDECFAGTAGVPESIGLLMAAQWQGALLWWAFDPKVPVQEFVEDGLGWFVSTLLGGDGAGNGIAPAKGRGSFV